MAKKEKKVIDVVLDILTKVKSVYSKDLYIKDSIYILPGNASEESLSGNTICEIHEEYINYVKRFTKGLPVIYIPNVVDFKTEVKAELDRGFSIEEITDVLNSSMYKWYSEEMDIYIKLTQKEKQIESYVLSDDTIWLKLNDIEPVALKAVFSDNEVGSIKYEDNPSLIVGKKTFPLLTDKNLDNIYITFGKESDNVYTVTSRLAHTYFTVFSVLTYLNID